MRIAVPASFLASLADQTEALKAEGLFKQERLIAGPQQAAIDVKTNGDTKEVLNLCANNYLGLANHPEVIAAAHKALDEYGYGMASVRFICGTQTIHKTLEERNQRLPRHRRYDPLIRPASTPTAASSRRCSGPRTRSSPTR